MIASVRGEVLHVVRTDEDEVGQHLVAHADVDAVVLTGASETARLFAGWRAGRESAGSRSARGAH